MSVRLLARTLQALSDPYCQSALIVCLSVCLSVRKFNAKYLGNYRI